MYFYSANNSADAYSGDANGLTNLFRKKATFYEFGAAGDLFEK